MAKATSILIVLLAMRLSISAQIPTLTYDPAAVAQAAENASTNSAIKLIQQAMKKDIEGMLRASNDVAESVKNANKLASNVTAIADIIDDTQEVIRRQQRISARVASINRRIERLQDEEFNPYTLRQVQSTVASSVRTATYAVKTVNLAVDAVNTGTDLLSRMNGVKEGFTTLEGLEKRLDSADYALQQMELGRQIKANMIYAYGGGSPLDIIGEDRVNRRDAENFKKGVISATTASKDRISWLGNDLMKILFQAGDILVVIIWISLAVAVFRQKMNPLLMMQLLFGMTTGYVLLKVIINAAI